MDNEKTVIEMRDFANKLRQRVEEFLKSVHDEYQDEFTHFVTKVDPGLSLIDKLAAQRLLVRSIAYELTRIIIQEQLPEELVLPLSEIKSEEDNIQRSTTEHV